ncbi:hypothetical protein IDG78_03810 [Pelagibacterales bacterium SAG-MED05]|nr:hypothetical protein [Pelagibacterales bacterium SAG-MED05]
MLNKFKKFLLEDYHRPSSKLFHFYNLFLKLFYNKNTQIFSERAMLLKKPPQNMIFYNYLGRFILIILNFVWIILFNKYFEKGTYVDKLENNDYSPEKNGRDSEPWPSQAVHLFEKKPSQLSHEFFIKIEKDYLNSTSLLLDQKNLKIPNGGNLVGKNSMIYFLLMARSIWQLLKILEIL